MICASSKDAIEEKLMGIKNELRENRYKEVRDHHTLAEKLGAGWGAVLSLPGGQACLEHLAALDLPMGVAGCPLFAGLVGLGRSQQGESSPFTPVAKQPPTS